jgi:hypothetical protein
MLASFGDHKVPLGDYLPHTGTDTDIFGTQFQKKGTI